MMLGYEWANPSTMMLSGGGGGGGEEEERHHQQEEAGAILEPMQQTMQQTMMGPMVNQQYQYITNQFEMLVDERGYMQVVPKREEIGLNLGVGGRTYFSAVAMEDEVVMRRLYQNQRREMMMSSPRCQAEGCNADLSLAKHYHRRHKVCDFHSKASSVLTAGLTQRFCQQCSRFHLLSEFDNGKRSCRKRLADHNRRRRKSHLDTSTSKPPLRSSNDSAGTHPSSSPSLSPPTISLDCFRQTHFHPSASSSSSSSSNSIFFSSG